MSLEWVQTTWGPLIWAGQPDFDKTYQLARGILNIDTERNELAKNALKDPAVTHLLWVDTDSICECPQDPNQSLRLLLACNAPIVSGLYRAKKAKGNYPYAMWMRNPHGEGYLAIGEWTGNFIRADAVGFGFCLVRREVFERVPPPWFSWRDRAPSEDFYFCREAIKQGYEIKVFTDVKLSHEGTFKVLTDGRMHVLDV